MARRTNRFGMLQVIIVLLVGLLICGIYIYREVEALNMNKAEMVSAEVSDGAVLEVHGINTEQSSCILIKSGDYSALIDAGDRGMEKEIDDYLKVQGVTKLDLVIATHPHADHIGSMQYILENYDVKQLIMPKLDKKVVPTSKLYKNLLLSIKENNIPVKSAEPGSQISLGQANLTFLAPLGEYSELNNYSVVTRLDFGKLSFIFTGDAEKESENDIIKSGANLKADVLYIGHHGGSTSSSEAFLDAIEPAAAFLQAGIDNKYGHPHKETLQRLEQRNVKLFRTDLDGHIVFKTDGNSLEAKTEKGMSETWSDFQ